MEYSLTSLSPFLLLGIESRLNPYSNGILPDILSESTLDFFILNFFLLLRTLNQGVNPFITIFSQMYPIESEISNKTRFNSCSFIYLSNIYNFANLKTYLFNLEICEKRLKIHFISI